MNWLDLLGGDDAWERENPPISRQDWIVTLGITLVVVLCLELIRSFVPRDQMQPAWAQYLAVATQTLPLLARRRFPLAVAVASFISFFVVVTWVPELGYQTATMVITFFAIYSGTAWARDRRQAVLVLGGLLVSMMLWVAWDVSVGNSLENFREARAGDQLGGGILPPLVAWVLYGAVVNLVFVGGAIAMGQSAWRQARDRALLEQAVETIEQQSRELQQQAVVDERLRIARELHDVVAHHVSVMGIQAAGARRLLQRNPEGAAEALANVEESARHSVTQMRGLLGALRTVSDDRSGAAGDGREPQPTLAELPQLVEDFDKDGLTVSLATVESEPGELEALPLPLQLSLYRTVQEALSNVVRHSTARHASVQVRTGAQRVEVEVLDDGRPRTGTSGSGLGLLGIRERVTSHGGSSEIGPRVTGGYRVRVRFPLSSTAKGASSPAEETR
ncbi:sensor histidine kinase [Luteococcus sp. OSA5]|uniref:sensor histidine kinase n=1 Tax=Luteococcus sp. OSA5 TaxID=3401630 RepID=UPI003B438592